MLDQWTSEERAPRNGQSTTAKAPVFSRQSTPDKSIACNQVTCAGADAMTATDQNEERGQHAASRHTSRHTPPPRPLHQQGATSHQLGQQATARHQPTPHTTPHYNKPSGLRGSGGSPGASSRGSPGSCSSTRRSANRRARAPSFATACSACSPPRTLQASTEVQIYIYVYTYIHAYIQ